MQRLSRYLKSYRLFPKDKIGLFTARLSTLQLQQGGFLPENIPYESWIFIEEGLMVELETRNKTRPRTMRIFFQGRSLMYQKNVFGKDVFRRRILKAAEPTTIYYWEPMEYIDGCPSIIYPALIAAMTRERSTQGKFYRILFSANRPRTVNKIIKNYPSLFRIPINNLCQYLCIIDVHQKKRLRQAHTIYFKSHPLPKRLEKGGENKLSRPDLLAYALDARN
jgi:hypothetical protein